MCTLPDPTESVYDAPFRSAWRDQTNSPATRHTPPATPEWPPARYPDEAPELDFDEPDRPLLPLDVALANGTASFRDAELELDWDDYDRWARLETARVTRDLSDREVSYGRRPVPCLD